MKFKSMFPVNTQPKTTKFSLHLHYYLILFYNILLGKSKRIKVVWSWMALIGYWWC